MRYPPEPPRRPPGRPVKHHNTGMPRPKDKGCCITGPASCPAFIFQTVRVQDAHIFFRADPSTLLKLRRGTPDDDQYAIRADTVHYALRRLSSKATYADALWWLYYNKFTRRQVPNEGRAITVFVNNGNAFGRIEYNAIGTVPMTEEVNKGMDKYLNIARQSRQGELARRPLPTLPPDPAPALTPTFPLIKDSLAGHAPTPRFLDPDGIIMECD